MLWNIACLGGNMVGRLNAFVDESLSLDGRSGGPLSGSTFAAKDLFDIAGRISHCGNPDWGRTHGPAETTSEAVRLLLEAGASLRGKTITDEFAFSIIGENHHYGTPINQNAPGRVCGGSSSGSAAAVAGGLVDFALGTDTGGSVRVPASFCGIFGLRPTHGRVSLGGVFPLAASFDTAGWFARDPDLMRQVGHILLADAVPEPEGPTRLLKPTDVWAEAEPKTGEVLSQALSHLESRYGQAVPMTLAEGSSLNAWFDCFRIAQGAEIWRTLGPWIKAVSPEIGPGIRERLEWCSSIDAESLDAANAERKCIAARLREVTADGSVLVMPAAPGPALEAGRSAVASNEIRARIIRLSGIAPLAGTPQLSLPVARVDGFPVALSLMGAPGTDETLLGMAAALCGTSQDGVSSWQ